MTFLLFTMEFPPQKGGVSKYYSNIKNYWPDSDLLVLTDGCGDNSDDENIIRRNLLFKYFRPRHLLSLFALFKVVRRLQKHGHQIEILVGQILPLGIPTYILFRIFKINYSVILHGLDFSLAAKKRITKKILSSSKNIICANNHTASRVKSSFSDLSEKVSVVNPGINPSFIRNPEKILELKRKYLLNGKKVLFSMGRLVLRKGVDKVILALKTVLQAEPDVVFVVGGAGPDEERLKALAFNAGIDNKIIFLGFIQDDDYWAWLELCDIFIMVSRDISGDYEGFGIVYLEANLAGKPVIAGDSGGVRDAVIDNVNGLLVDPEDENEIATAIIKLFGNNELCQEMGASGNRRVVEIMSARKTGGKNIQQIKILNIFYFKRIL